jgi:glutathione synthase/RimK-type ligase-like ATP-grasp enzyme
MLLILSNCQDATSDYLAGILRQQSVDFFRFDTDVGLENATFEYSVGCPRLNIDGRCFTPDNFTNVWYRRPERLKHPKIDDSPEGKLTLEEWTECLEAFLAHIPRQRWVNHPSANVAASQKLEQLTTARRLRFDVPDTLVTQDARQLKDFFHKHHGKLIAKPLSVGHVERKDSNQDTIIYTSEVEAQHLDELVDLGSCPTLFQQRVDKVSDIRITVVDRDIHAIELIAKESDGSQRCDIRRNNMDDVNYRKIELPTNVATKIISLTEHYGLRFAAIDMAVTTRGEWIYFEINPNGQWAWMDLAGVSNISASFVRAFSAGAE